MKRRLQPIIKALIGPSAIRVLKNPRHARFELAWRGWALTENERRLQALHNRYQGQRCFIIGNGPSLRHTDLSRLKNEITLGSNGLLLLFEESSFRPTFYTLEDRLTAQDRATEINALTGVIKLLPLDVQQWLPPTSDTIYINFWRNYWPFPQFSTQFDRLVYWGGTVTYLNLQLAYFLGCPEVYLVGVDHQWTMRPTEEPDENGLIISQGEDQNHFDPRYLGSGGRWYHPRTHRMEEAYHAAKVAYKADGRVIYNATIGGQLEVFPRCDYHQLLK